MSKVSIDSTHMHIAPWSKIWETEMIGYNKPPPLTNVLVYKRFIGAYTHLRDLATDCKTLIFDFFRI